MWSIIMPSLIMATASGNESLFDSTDCRQWRAALECYERVVKLVADQKRKKSGKLKEEGLPELDTW